MDLLRLATSGSVDDGKSTLIGRLLYDTKSIYQDSLRALEAASRKRSPNAALDLSLLTDGLRAEREQGITIDVAYRYFSTSRRKFILADTPGHVQYTRNMITGTAGADATLVLIDAEKGVVQQTKRHALIASIMGTQRVVFCVNKMDLVGYSQARFAEIAAAVREVIAKLGFRHAACLPISALAGDNVVNRSDKLAWYDGPPLLEHLEGLPIETAGDALGARVVVQLVQRTRDGARGYAGFVAAGALRVGDEVTAWPSGVSTRVSAIERFEGALDVATASQPVVVRLADEIDLGRGDLLAAKASAPTVTRDLEVTLCWLDQEPLRQEQRYYLLHAASERQCVVKEIKHHLDVETLEISPSRAPLGPNDIARAVLRAAEPVACDSYCRSKITGSVLLVNQKTNRTAAAGMVV